MASNETSAGEGASKRRQDVPAEVCTKNKKITKYCCVPQCVNYAVAGLHFHKFPQDPRIKQAWIVALKMGKEVTCHDWVCEGHFLPSDYLPQANPTKRRYLKMNSIPSQNLPVRSHDNVDTSPQKRKKEARDKRAEGRRYTEGKRFWGSRKLMSK